MQSGCFRCGSVMDRGNGGPGRREGRGATEICSTKHTRWWQFRQAASCSLSRWQGPVPGAPSRSAVTHSSMRSAVVSFQGRAAPRTPCHAMLV